MTRAEIEEKLIAIVKQEKNVADDLLKPETTLADAGIDSLDSLTILFAMLSWHAVEKPSLALRGPLKRIEDRILAASDRKSGAPTEQQA